MPAALPANVMVTKCTAHAQSQVLLKCSIQCPDIALQLYYWPYFPGGIASDGCLLFNCVQTVVNFLPVQGA